MHSLLIDCHLFQASPASAHLLDSMNHESLLRSKISSLIRLPAQLLFRSIYQRSSLEKRLWAELISAVFHVSRPKTYKKKSSIAWTRPLKIGWLILNRFFSHLENNLSLSEMSKVISERPWLTFCSNPPIFHISPWNVFPSWVASTSDLQLLSCLPIFPQNVASFFLKKKEEEEGVERRSIRFDVLFF